MSYSIPSAFGRVVPALDPTGTGLTPTVRPAPAPPAPSEGVAGLIPAGYTPRTSPLAGFLDLAHAHPIFNADGHIVLPSSDGIVDVGGHQLSFDSLAMQGRITPALGREMMDTLDLTLQGAPISFTGSDLRIVLELTELPVGTPLQAKQLLECTTMTVSVYRVKSPVRAAGFINPKGFVRGTRTIAGTIVLTQFTAEVMMRFLQVGLAYGDKSRGDWYSKVDQLPPFNLTLFFCNEQGLASYRRLLGVELITDGTTYSQHDLLTEQTLTYVASDFTPLLPLTISSLWNPSTKSRDAVPTPGDRLRRSVLV